MNVMLSLKMRNPFRPTEPSFGNVEEIISPGNIFPAIISTI